MRLLMVSPRFGTELIGGAENLIRALAIHAPDEWDVEIATTCATDHHFWINTLPEGEGEEDGLLVRRFPVDPRDEWQHERLAAHLHLMGELDPARELQLMGSSVWSSALQRHLDVHGTDYDLMLFGPYLFGTTFWGVQSHPARSVLIPCIHDEPYAYMACVRQMMEAVAGCMFNSAGEQRLAERLFQVRAGAVVGVGFDPLPPADMAALPAEVAAITGPYLVYAGRQEEGKRVDVAVEYAARLADAGHDDLRLVLVGSGSYRVPGRYAGRVVQAGFVSEETKRAIMRGALALVNPSEMESFSIVLMEAWREGTPVVVAAGSEVMADHCRVSGGGFTFADYPQFAEAVQRLHADPAARTRMGEAGRAYVEREWSWQAVRGRFRDAVGLIQERAAAGAGAV